MSTVSEAPPAAAESAGPALPDAGALLEGLNPNQRAAVLHEGSPLLIVAGAGSGKTRVLTHRIAYLLAARGVRPGQVLAITFTNKAAGEMKERVAALVGPRAASMWVSTFHSACVRILRREATYVGTAADGTHTDRMLAEAYRLYQQRLRQANALDFDDLIMMTVNVLQAFPDVAEHYRRRFRHVLVDEYQDTNQAQYQLVRELVGTGEGPVPMAELCVVGDADQSIYAFRGATIRNIDEFERDYPDATTILLEQNYRSTQRILKAANTVIAKNTGRRPKNLWTDSGDGELIEGYVADNEHDEAAWVAEQIDALVDEGTAQPKDIAVFYRTNNASRVFEEVFIRVGMPYKVVGGVRFYERKEVPDALAYLQVASNPADVVSLP